MEYTEKIMQLLNNVKSIHDKYDNLYNETASQFNIFKITNMAYKEVHICQVIKELLDPNGLHHQGDIYFRLFVKHVLKIDNLLDESDYKKVSVVTEQVIPNDRRIDIYIEIGNKFAIPIEAKIYASDLNAQCSDYFEYASKRDKVNTLLYYLTLDGREPSENSINNLAKENIRLISFREEIITWLNNCIMLEQTKKNNSIHEIILQLNDVLNEITGKKEDGKIMETKELIKDKISYKSAALLRQAVTQIDNELRKDILREIDRRIKLTYNLNKIINTYDFECVSERSKGYQGCCYKLADTKIKDYAVALRITFGTYLYAEICLLDNDEIYWDDVSKILKTNKVVENPDNIFKSDFNWKYFIEDKNNRPNFDNPNDAYYNLIEKEYFNYFIDNVMIDLDIFLSKLTDAYKVGIK